MTTGLRVPRVLTLTAFALALMTLAAVPAQAHGGTGTGPNSRLHTRLVSVAPSLPGVTVQVGDDGEWVTLANTGETDVVVYGYEKEPYLRVGPDGVWQNMLSPATYMNQSMQIGDIPDTVDTKAPPRWVRLNLSQSASWHDHRVHWMGGALPPVVQNDLGSAHLVNAWTIRAMQGSTPITITGTISFVPVSGYGYFIAIPILAVLLLGVGAIVVMKVRRQRLRPGTDSGLPRERDFVDA